MAKKTITKMSEIIQVYVLFHFSKIQNLPRYDKKSFFWAKKKKNQFYLQNYKQNIRYIQVMFQFVNRQNKSQNLHKLAIRTIFWT